MINCVIELLDWDELFEGKKVHDQFWLFSKTILKIFTILFPTKLLLALRKIYHGLMMKPDILQITKVKYVDTIYILGNYHYVKSVQIHSFFWSIFSCIRTEYGDFLPIQSECRKVRTRKNSVLGHFSYSVQHDYNVLVSVSNSLIAVLKYSKQKYHLEFSNKLKNSSMLTKHIRLCSKNLLTTKKVTIIFFCL